MVCVCVMRSFSQSFAFSFFPITIYKQMNRSFNQSIIPFIQFKFVYFQTHTQMASCRRIVFLFMVLWFSAYLIALSGRCFDLNIFEKMLWPSFDTKLASFSPQFLFCILCSFFFGFECGIECVVGSSLNVCVCEKFQKKIFQKTLYFFEIYLFKAYFILLF